MSVIVFGNILQIAAILMSLTAICQSRRGGTTTDTHDKKVVCYWGTWSHYRPKDGQFQVDNINPHLCTHLIYSFAGLVGGEIRSLDAWLDLGDETPGSGLKNFQKTVELKKVNPNLKVTIAIGGWNEGSQKYSEMAKDANSRKKFVKSVLKMLGDHGFDGLDLDWEYPGKRGGKPYDKKNFVLLVKELKEAFEADPNDYILTAAIGAAPETIKQSYDIQELYKYLDLVHVMCYDYHGSWDKKTGHNAPLYAKPDAQGNDLIFTVAHSWKVLKELGAIAEKTVMGVPFYGRTYILANPHDNRLGAKAIDGFAGPYTREAGFMGYNEVCEELNGPEKSKWTVKRDEDIKAPYMYNDKKWACYDDEESITEKVKFAMKNNMAGIMIWSLDTDDFRGKCGVRFPLLRAINKALSGHEESSSSATASATARPSFSMFTLRITAITFAIHQILRV